MKGIIYICATIMYKIIHADRKLFEFVNDHLHNSFFDFLMPLMRNSSTWYPLYIFLLAFVLINFKKDKWQWVLFAITTVYVSNYVSSNLIKENIHRLRPCNDPDLMNKIHFLIGYKPQSSSFTSSHATNHFAMASFFFFTLKRHIGNISLLFLLWAAVICFAQVYVGVHFPLDVLCGGIIGYLFGYLSATSFNKRYFLM
jgi:membrane-associated phospholipid phosphatase